MGPLPVDNSVKTLAANAGPDTAFSSAIKGVNDGANAIHQTTKAAVDDLGFNKPSLFKWGKWLVGKLGPFGYFATIVLSPILIPASLTYDVGRGMKLLFRKITRVEEPVQKLLPMVAKQVEDAGKLKQYKQNLESRHAEVSDQLAAWKTHSGELKSLNDQFSHRAQQLEQKLNREQIRNHELNDLLELLANRADDLELENADNRKRYQAIRVELDKQLAEKSLRIEELSKELEAARQQHDLEDDIWARKAQADKIRSLESKLAADQQQLCDLEARYQAGVRNIEGQHHSAVMELEKKYQSEVKDLHNQHQLEVHELMNRYEGHIQAINDENEEQVQKLRGEINDVHELMKDKDLYNEDLQDVKRQLEARVSQLEQQCSKSYDQRNNLEVQFNNLLEKNRVELESEKRVRSELESDIQQLQTKLDELSSTEKVSHVVQTPPVTVIEPRELVDTASQAEMQPPTVLVYTAFQAEMQQPPVLVDMASQTEIDFLDNDYQQVVSERGEVPVESEVPIYHAQKNDVETLRAEDARLEAERELLLNQAVSEDAGSQGMPQPVHCNSQQGVVSVNVDTQHELENITGKLHAAENPVLVLSKDVEQKP